MKSQEHKEDLSMERWKAMVNRLGKFGKPFLFIIDYDMKHPQCYDLESLPPNILFALHDTKSSGGRIKLHPHPVSFDAYRKGYDQMQFHLHQGDTYLVNYTLETPIDTNNTLREIFDAAVAPYKLLVEPSFVVFSPETFVTIDETGTISTFPMKGTIDASLPDAENYIMNNAKEASEHATVVDLLRNDLSRVASDVRVDQFRFIQRIKRPSGELLQVSSKITGQLPGDWPSRIGDILCDMLPAGSVTGAPKTKTLKIISEVETHKRGFYTGIFGIFDGKCLDSAVMIRFIELRDGKLYYKSGGGITTQSRPDDEYDELIQKIYVPVG